MEAKTKYPILLPIILSGVILFIFVLVKAYTSSFTHDESFSYLHYPNESFMEIISFSNWYTNNHILNSLFMKYSEQLIGNSELALRLPNLILLLVYMIYSYKLFKNKGSILSVSIFLILCTNILLIDLFGLARGYGLSIGFMLMSLFHFIEYFKSKNIKHLYLFHFSALLASLSNFTLVTFYVTMLIVYNLISLLNSLFQGEDKYHIYRTNKIHLIPLAIVTIILYEPLRRLISYCELNFGGKNGFFEDTVTHLIQNTLYNVNISPNLFLVLKILFSVIVIIPFIIILTKAFQNQKEFFTDFQELIISNLILIIISTVIILQHVILGSDYPISRFSIFLFPLFMIHLGYYTHYLTTSIHPKTFLIIISALAIASTTNFSVGSSIYSSVEWKYDRETKNMMQTLETYFQENNDSSQKIKLGSNWLFVPTINYYKKRYQYDWLLPVDREGIKETDDYIYIFENELDSIEESKIETVIEFKDTKTYLIKNKHL